MLYFQRNPRAADSLEGVARWRLLDEKIYESLEEIGLALEWLVSQDLLVKESTPHSGALFRLNTEKLPEITRSLEQNRKP